MQGFGQKVGDDFYRKKDAEKFGILRDFVILSNICCILLEMGFRLTAVIVENSHRKSAKGNLDFSENCVNYSKCFKIETT